MSKSFYYQHAGALNRELKQTIPTEELKKLHRKSPLRHFVIAGRQISLLIILPLVIYHFQHPLIWIPASIWMGFNLFGFMILLHEAVHKCIFNKDPYNLTLWLGHVYALCSGGLAYSQFRRWHLDHHNELGSATEDPKRAYLSPAINARWYKLLYATPWLFVLYTRASARAQANYPDELKRRIKREKLLGIGFDLGVLIWFWNISPLFALKAWIIPLFFVFPVAFILNRIGQHYVVDPDKVGNWSTLVRPNPFWNFIFLFSSYHLEHHYFPAVPFYRLKALQRALEPFFAKHQIPGYNYTQLLKYWFVDNHQAHTKPKDALSLSPTAGEIAS